MAAKKRQKKKRSFLAALLDGLLTVIDRLCEGIANLAVGLVKAVLRGIFYIMKGLCWGLWQVLRLLWWPFARLGRFIVGRHNRASRCLRLTGVEFEEYMGQVLKDNGFRHVQVTVASGDQGADILAVRNGKTYAIQCKNYQENVGNFAVQEAYAAQQYYGCDFAVVICPGEFTRSARELAESTGVLLWNGDRLSHLMKVSGRRPHHDPGR